MTMIVLPFPHCLCSRSLALQPNQGFPHLDLNSGIIDASSLVKQGLFSQVLIRQELPTVNFQLGVCRQVSSFFLLPTVLRLRS